MTDAFRSDGPNQASSNCSSRQVMRRRPQPPSMWRASDGNSYTLVLCRALAGRPEYICVSYLWGSGRTANPFDPDRPMSVRAGPSLETALATTQPRAISVNAACKARTGLPAH